MKVKALANIKHGGRWIFTGETFEANEAELKELAGLVEQAGPAPEAKTEAEKPEEEKAPRRTGTKTSRKG